MATPQSGADTPSKYGSKAACFFAVQQSVAGAKQREIFS
jgi:hypothetical protein